MGNRHLSGRPRGTTKTPGPKKRSSGQNTLADTEDVSAVESTIAGVVTYLRTGNEITVKQPDHAVFKALGLRLPDSFRLILSQVTALTSEWSTEAGAKSPFDTGTSLLIELAPRNASEALLVSQMIGTQAACTEFLRRSMIPSQAADHVDANVLRATRLGRLFNEQLEAFAKLRGKTGRQRVIVKHVTVNAGGRAIVGTVNPRKGGGATGAGGADGTETP